MKHNHHHHEHHQNPRKRTHWKSIIITFACLVIIGGIVVINVNNSSGNSGTNANQERGTLSADVASFNFGQISMAAGKVSREFIVNNRSFAPVTINRLTTSCMCTSAELTIRGEILGPFGMPGHGIVPKINARVEPGEDAVVKVTFDPAAHGPAGVGTIARDVYLDQVGGRRLTLSFKANVTP